MNGSDLIGLWRSNPLEMGAMEAGSVAFATDGTGWYELANALGSEIKQFTWYVSAAGLLSIRFTRYLLLDTAGSHAGVTATLLDDHILDQSLDTSYRIGSGFDVFGKIVTILDLVDPLVVDRRFAFDQPDVPWTHDPSFTQGPTDH